MTDTNLLKSKMIAAGDENFVACLAELLDISRTTASGKLNGEKPFTQVEISLIATKYNLTDEDIRKIFVRVENNESN